MLQQLSIVSGPFKGENRIIDQDEIVIGRSEECDWTIHDQDISRQHMKVIFNAGEISVADLESTNGVYINRQKIFEPSILQIGDLLLVGQTAILLNKCEDDKVEDSSAISGRFDIENMPSFEDIKTSMIMPGLDAKDIPDLIHNSNLKHKLGILYNICSQGSRITDLVKYFDFVFKELFKELEFRKIIALRLNKDMYEVVHYYNESESELEIDDLSQTILNYCIENQQVVSSNYAQGDERFKSSESLRQQMPLAIMCAPLMIEGKVLGAVSMDVENIKRVFTSEDLMLFSACAANLAWALNHNIMLKGLLEQQRKESDMKIAQEIQSSCIPDINRLPVIQGVDVGAWYQPFEMIGGDFFEIKKLGNCLVLFNADVSGKGVSASLIVSLIKAYLKTIMLSSTDPYTILCALHSLLDGDMPKKMFVTASVASIDLKTNKVRFARAGHTYLIHYVASSQTIKLIGGKGIMLGAASTDIFKTRLEKIEFPIGRNDILFLYTDGYVEARNGRGEQFGEDRLSECVQTFSKQSARNILEKIDQAVKDYAAEDGVFDDMCGILMKYLG